MRKSRLGIISLALAAVVVLIGVVGVAPAFSSNNRPMSPPAANSWWSFAAPSTVGLGAPTPMGTPVNPAQLFDPSDSLVLDPSASSETSSSCSTSGPQAVPADAYEIINTFDCQCFNGQKTIAYRRGYYKAPNTGFGRTKVIEKHNLQDKAVSTVVASPKQKPDGGSAGIATNYANRIVDGNKQTVEVQVVYDTRELSDKRSFGIVTGYCLGYDGACPDWINAIP